MEGARAETAAAKQAAEDAREELECLGGVSFVGHAPGTGGLGRVQTLKDKVAELERLQVLSKREAASAAARHRKALAAAQDKAQDVRADLAAHQQVPCGDDSWTRRPSPTR